MERWPHMMKRATAASYCDLSESAFIGEVASGRLPAPVNLGGRDHWFKPALDKALAIIAGMATAEYEKDFWGRDQAA
jgi:hypothetical protein